MWIVSLFTVVYNHNHEENIDFSDIKNMEKRMEKRKRGAANDLEVALSEGDEDREKRIQYSKHQYCGILLSVTILLSFIYFMLSRTDILHIALLHGTNDYHPTHVSEKINGLASASLTQPSIINFNTASTHSDSAGSKFLEVKKDLLDQEPQLHHKIVLPKPVLATAADNSNPFREDHPDSHVESRGLEASLTDLQAEAEKQIMVVRKMKFEQHLVMETDTRAKEQIVILQDKVRKYLHAKYGTGPYYLEMSIHFPDTMMQDGREQKEKIIVELGPVEFIPYCVYYFLQLVETWKGGAFHRNAGHVLQAFVKSQREGLAFQEYSPEFPHKKYTMGYAGKSFLHRFVCSPF